MWLNSHGGEVVSQRVVGTAGKPSCLRPIRWDLPHTVLVNTMGWVDVTGKSWSFFPITWSGEGFKGQDQHLKSHLEVTGSQ